LGINGNISKLNEFNVTSICKKLNISKDFGTIFSVDIQLRSKAENNDIKIAADAIKSLIKMQLEGMCINEYMNISI
jgi:hypothetical protein